MITDPLQAIEINGRKYDSLISLYVENKSLYQSLSNKKSRYYMRISNVIREFFQTTRKPPKGVSQEKKVERYKREWQKIVEAQERKAIREAAWRTEIKKLIARSDSGDCVWEELYSGLSSGQERAAYTAELGGKRYELVMTAIRTADAERKIWLELTGVGESKKKEVYPKDYNAALYRVVKKMALKKAHEGSRLSKPEPGTEKKVIQIEPTNFVVRTNLFRCFHKEHLVEEIIGRLTIVTPLGKRITENIPCAYCPKCNCFYMLTSVYNRVSEKGVLLCQLIDKEEYYKTGKTEVFAGAKSSLLMQNGYNVKANNGLTDLQRQIILESILDNGIMTPHQIVSYLDTFVAQKQKLIQYSEAVSKWRRDREFVLAYDTESKRTVNIERIKK